MRGAVLLGNRRVEIREFPDPRPGPNQVVVRTKASGLCGSELHFRYERDPQGGPLSDSDFWNTPGGHEPCGVVEQVGEGVTGLQPGDRVVVYHIVGCGHCKYCRAGWMLHCADKRTHGFGIGGGHGELILTNAMNCVVLPDGLSFADGACCACGTGTAYQALRRLNVSGNDRFVAYGLGPVGLSAVMLAKAMGAEVIGVDLVPERLELAKRLGASVVINAVEENPVQVVKDLTGGEGVEVAADFSANPQARNNALDSVRIWGRVAFVGEGNKTTIEPSPQMLHRQLTVLGSWVFGLWELRTLLDWLAWRGLHPDAMVTHRFPVEQLKEGMDLFASGKTGKVMIEWA